MSVDLIPIGNHKIHYANRSFSEVAEEIKRKLNSFILVDVDFLMREQLPPKKFNYVNCEDFPLVDEWQYLPQDEDRNFEELGRILFIGPFYLELYFEKNRIYFWQPAWNYYAWFETEDNEYRNKWRKYLQQIVNIFGGDRVIYLGDSNHPLSKFDTDFYEGVTFEETEKALLDKFGESKKSYADVADDIERSYFTDTFEDLDIRI